MSRASSPGSGRSNVFDGVSVGIGFSRGFAAFVLVLILIGLFLFVEIASAAGGAMGAGAGRLILLATVGLTYGSHLGALQGTSLSVIGGASTIPVFVYYLVPIGVLVWYGRRTARASSVETPGQAAMAGVSMAVGYFVGVVASYFLLVAILSPYGAGFSISNQLIQVLIVVGLVYPAVFGGIGGFTTKMNESSFGAGNRQRRGGRTATQANGPRDGEAGATPQGRTDSQQRGGQPGGEDAQGSRRRSGEQRARTGEAPSSASNRSAASNADQAPSRGSEGTTCPACGAAITRDAEFCGECGTRIQESG